MICDLERVWGNDGGEWDVGGEWLIIMGGGVVGVWRECGGNEGKDDENVVDVCLLVDW